MMSESGFRGGTNGRPATARRLTLASGLAVTAVLAGTSMTWASVAAPDAASSARHAAGAGTGAAASGPSATSLSHTKKGRLVELFGPDDLPGSPVRLVAGDTLRVHLEEQSGSTGLAWSVSSVGKGLEPAGGSVTPIGEPGPGAPDNHTFAFRAVRCGTMTLTFDLVRGDDAPARTVSLTVVVGKGGASPVPLAPTVDVRGPEGLPKRPVEVDAGNTLAVHLTERSSSTGLSWSAVDVPHHLLFLGDEVVPGGNRPGAAGEHVFRYRVLEARPGSLSFALSRPGGTQAEQTVTFRIAPLAAHRTITVNGPDGLLTGPVKAHVGDRLVVHLSEQSGSTGYSWSPARIPDNLTLTGDSYVPGQFDLDGAAGERILSFRVDDPGRGTLSLVLARPWEDKPIDEIRLTVSVKP